MSIYDKIITTPQAEISGSDSSSRFLYQRNWALSHLLKLHINGESYVFAFEFHDDVLVLDSEEKPTKLSFFQVKTKKAKNWTINELTTSSKNKRTGDVKLSILGKLYQHKTNFNTENVELFFVTDSYFSFNSTTAIIKGLDLNQKDQDKILLQINKELPTVSATSLNELFFIHADLNLDDQETHIRGKIHNFFKDIFGEDHGINVEAWYKTLITEIEQRNNFRQTDITNLNEFFRNKCISKSYIEEILNKIESDIRVKPAWDTVKGLITNAKPYEMIQYEKYWNQFATDKLDSSLYKLHKLYEYITQEVEKVHKDTLDIYSMAIDIVNKIKITSLYDEDIFPDIYIQTIIFWSYYECSNRTV